MHNTGMEGIACRWFFKMSCKSRKCELFKWSEGQDFTSCDSLRRRKTLLSFSFSACRSRSLAARCSFRTIYVYASLLAVGAPDDHHETGSPSNNVGRWTLDQHLACLCCFRFADHRTQAVTMISCWNWCRGSFLTRYISWILWAVSNSKGMSNSGNGVVRLLISILWAFGKDVLLEQTAVPSQINNWSPNNYQQNSHLVL